MFNLSKDDVMTTLSNYDKIMSRIVDVVDEIGFLTKEYDTLEIEKTEFLGDPIDTVYVVAYDSHYDMYDWTPGEFPLDFLFEDEAAHKDWYKNKREEAEKQYENARKKAQRERELNELNRLKKKYES